MTTNEAAERGTLLNEIRYAERLCERTARMYHRLASSLRWAELVGAGSVFLTLKKDAPAWLSTSFGLVWLAIWAAGQVAKPDQLAAVNRAEWKRYARLGMDLSTSPPQKIERALKRARMLDIHEVESLRDVAWNDVMLETGNSEKVVSLTRWQRFLAWLS